MMKFFSLIPVMLLGGCFELAGQAPSERQSGVVYGPVRIVTDHQEEMYNVHDQR